jgi:phytoene synthase
MSNLSYCAQQVRRQDNERFLCALFAPPPRRESLFALYAFNLELAAIPGKVSEPLLGRMRFQWWREALDGAAGGAPVHHQVIAPLIRAINETGVDKSALHRLIDARAIELDETPTADLAALGAYAAGTAGLLAEMTLDILGVADAAAREAARHVGQAVAGVDILRAVPTHAARRHLYLPVESVKAAGLEAESVFGGRAPGALRRVVAEVADWAARHLNAARLNRGNIPPEALPALLPAVLVDMHLNRLRRRNFDPFDPRLRRPAPWLVIRLWRCARQNRF